MIDPAYQRGRSRKFWTRGLIVAMLAATVATGVTLAQQADGYPSNSKVSELSVPTGGSDGDMQITLVPSGAEQNQWSWNGSLRSAPKALSYGMADGNLFGLTSSTGSLSASSGTSLSFTARLEQIQKRGFIVGYPEVLYGYKPFGALLTQQAEQLRLPMTVSRIPDVWCVASYAIHPGNDPELSLDVAYDLWLTKEFKPTAVKKGDIELMIWIYHKNLKPAGSPLKGSRFEMPTYQNGTIKRVPWIAFLSNVNSPTRTSILLSLVVDSDGSGLEQDGGTGDGEVGVNLQEILQRAVLLVSQQVGWERSYVESLYVSDIELGSEFGTKADRAAFDWTLRSYKFVFGSPVKLSSGVIRGTTFRLSQ